jgi:predicted phage terminase large subunit-like protein
MEDRPEVRELTLYPERIGRCVGFTDLTEMHGEWIQEMVFGEEDYTLQAHRGSFKSSCLAVAIALLMVLYPSRNIIFLRKTDSNVAEMMTMVSKILGTKVMKGISGKVHQKKPLRIVSESLDHISTNLWHSPMGSYQLQGFGMRTSITGKHAFYVITDDICNIDDRISRAERQHTIAQYDELQNIRNRGGRIINLGTPWHKDDVFCRMPNIHRYDCYATKLISQEQLDALRASMPPSMFAANYELKHIAAENAFFTTPPVFTDNPLVLRDGISHVDASYGGEDYTAFTCGKRKGNRIYLYGRIWHRHVDKVLEEIIGEAERMMCWPLYTEDNGDKGFVCKEIRRRGYYAKKYTEHQNKVIKISSYLRKWWPNIVFVRGTDQAYIDQILDYTEQAEHDDAPDSAASVCRRLDTHYW